MSLLEILKQIPDKRRKQGQKYDLAHVLFYSILSVLCGANSYAGIHTVMSSKQDLLNAVFGTKWKRAPGVSTIFYVFNSLDITELEKVFRLHAKDLIKDKQIISEGSGDLLNLAIDGKSLRGTGSKTKNSKTKEDKLQQVLSIFESKEQIILAHLDSVGKGNELKSMQTMIAEIDLPTSVFTADALHTQKKL